MQFLPESDSNRWVCIRTIPEFYEHFFMCQALCPEEVDKQAGRMGSRKMNRQGAKDARNTAKG
jgi:hypothetical protein